MPPNTKKCECPVPNGIFKQKGRTAWYECSKCGKRVEFTITPTPEKEKCEIEVGCPPIHEHKDEDGDNYICDKVVCPFGFVGISKKPTPAVEDWTKELYRGLCKDCDSDTAHEIVKCTRHTKGLNPIWVNGFIRSLLESDRKRIVEWAEKNQSEDVIWCSSLKHFITNLK